MRQYKLLVFDCAGRLFRRLKFDFENDQSAIDFASFVMAALMSTFGELVCCWDHSPGLPTVVETTSSALEIERP